VASERPLRVAWKCFELRPGGAPIDPAKRAAILSFFPRLRARAAELGVEMSAEHPALGVDTRRAHEGLKFFAARHPEREAEFVRAVFRAHWVEGGRIDDPELLVRLAAACGADAEAFRAALTDGTYRDAVLGDEREAARLGIRGVPAYAIEDALVPAGFLPAAELSRMIDEVLDWLAKR
jgi:predicted DsbA family dithiol-disulfide isomerase